MRSIPLHGGMRIAALAAALVSASPLAAQEPARDSARTSPAALPTVRVTATREGPRAPVELPYAVTLTRPDSFAALRRLGADELLFAVPGVALANRQNPAQDPRISIRGFGARSAPSATRRPSRASWAVAIATTPTSARPAPRCA